MPFTISPPFVLATGAHPEDNYISIISDPFVASGQIHPLWKKALLFAD